MFKWLGAFGGNVRAAATVIVVIVGTTALALAGQDFPKNGIVKNGARQEAPVALATTVVIFLYTVLSQFRNSYDRRRHDVALQHAPQVMASSVTRQSHSEQGRHPPTFRQAPPGPRQDGPV